MPFSLGFWANSANYRGDFELISSTILNASTDSVTFSNLDSYTLLYDHLQIRAILTHDNSTPKSAAIQFNGDTASNYSTHKITGNGSTIVSSAATSQTSIPIAFSPGNTVANTFGAAIIDILDSYNNLKNTTIKSISGSRADSSEISLYSGAWLSTNPITSITLIDVGTGNFTAGSRFSLYGIRG